MGLERQYKVCNFGLKAETHWSLKQTCQLLRVYFPVVALLIKKGRRHRRKIYMNSRWLYSYFTQTSPSKNKDINYIFIYLGVFRCFSSGSIYDPNYNYEVHTITFQTFFVWAFKIVVDSWKFTMLLLYILWDDWPIFMISGSNKQLQQQLKYILLKGYSAFPKAPALLEPHHQIV